MLIQNTTSRTFFLADGIKIAGKGTKKVDDKLGAKLVADYPGELIDFDKVAKEAGGADVKALEAENKALTKQVADLTAKVEELSAAAPKAGTKTEK